MKTYKQIVKDIEKTQNKIKNYDAQIEKLSLHDEIREAIKTGTREAAKKLILQQEENDKQIIILSDKRYIEKIVLLYLQDNKKIALWEYCKPFIIEILTKYNNKAFGQKTTDKIYQEIKEKTNCSIWIEGGGMYGCDKIHIRHLDDYYNEVQINMAYNNRLLENNKINVEALNDISVKPYEVYTEKPHQAAKKLITLHKKALEQIEEAEKALKAYSNYAPSTININTYISNKPYRTIL